MSLESRKNAAMADPGAEMLDRMTGAWSRYGRIVLGVVAGVAVVGAVSFLWMRNNATQENLASQRLAEADALFWRGDYERSRTIAQEVARTYGSTHSGIDAHRVAGDNAYWKGDWKEAITEYRAYLAKQGSGLPADAVRRSLAYSLESTQQYAEAVKLYDGLVGKFERESSGEFLAAAARCLESQGNKAGAIQHLQRLLDEFGDTSGASRARVKLAELQAAGS